MGGGTRAAGAGSGCAHLRLAAQAALSHPRGRARSDGVRIRPDLGLGQCHRQYADDAASPDQGRRVLSARPGLSARLRTFRAGFSVAMPGGSGFHASRARAEGIRKMAHGLSAANRRRRVDQVAAGGGGDGSQRSKTGASRRTQSQPCLDAGRHCAGIAAVRSAAGFAARHRRATSRGITGRRESGALRRQSLARHLRVIWVRASNTSDAGDHFLLLDLRGIELDTEAGFLR